MLIQYLFLGLVCSELVSSATIIPPGMQRKILGESCTFHWMVQGSFANYTVVKKSTGALGANANHTRDDAGGRISLTIRNVRLDDAGNYSLSINVGTSSTTDHGALLFVYGNPQSSLNQTNGTIPATEGSCVELTCIVASTSQPVSHRPSLYYFWGIGAIPRLQNISSGPATLPNGDPLTGYSIRNDGRTLVIDSVQFEDRLIRCWGQEEGTPSECCPATHNLQLYYRPQIVSRRPPNRKFHSDVGNQVQLAVSVSANPVITAWSWTFVSMSGVETPLPPIDAKDHQNCMFNLSSQTYYGNYTINLNNGIGFTSETFQVLVPERPEPPSHLRVVYATHREIFLRWNCMWYNGHQQTVSVRLEETADNTYIETQNTTLHKSCYNVTQATRFQSMIRPETSYEVSIWSINALGPSLVLKLAVITPMRFKLIVSSKTITINGTEAIINFSPLNGNMTRLSVTCCSESSATCRSSDYPITDAVYRVVFSKLPEGDLYFFDFTVFGVEGSYLTMVKGIRVSRTGADDDETKHPLLIATALLAVLLVIAIVALVGSLLFFLVMKKQPREEPPKLPTIEEKTPTRQLPKRPLPERKSVPPATKKPPQDDEDDTQETYEAPDAPKSQDDAFYMPLNEKPTRAKRNQYS